MAWSSSAETVRSNTAQGSRANKLAEGAQISLSRLAGELKTKKGTDVINPDALVGLGMYQMFGNPVNANDKGSTILNEKFGIVSKVGIKAVYEAFHQELGEKLKGMTVDQFTKSGGKLVTAKDTEKVLNTCKANLQKKAEKQKQPEIQKKKQQQVGPK